MDNRLPQIVFLLSLFVLVCGGAFLTGYLSGQGRLAGPGRLVNSMEMAAKSLVKTGGLHPISAFVNPAPEATGDQLTIHDPSALEPGYRIFLGYDGRRGQYTAWLFDETGTALHRWELDYASIDGDGPLNHSDFAHGMEVLRDGSLLINFDLGDAMARFDTCGKPVWVREGVYHHSLEMGAGGVWTWRGVGAPQSHEQFIELLDPQTGETLRSISLIDRVIRPAANGPLLFSLPDTFQFKTYESVPPDAEDVFHPNDVEELSQELAPAFPMFEAGDLLMNFRNIHLVAVLDPDTYEIKWARNGPWRFQHDPDFQPDGRITVFDNAMDRAQSDIIAVHPGTGAVERIFADSSLRFYSNVMGKHQRLPNGNWLITVPGEGRVIEVDARGNLVMQFNNLLSSGQNGRTSNGQYLPPDFFETVPACAS